MDANTFCIVKNRSSSKVGYVVPEDGVRREFAPGETKKISYGELEKLSFQPGGVALMTHFLQVRTFQPEEAKTSEIVSELGIHTEPEYYMDEAKIKEVMVSGSVDAFKDMMDFAPVGVIDLIKKYAVELPLESTPKIEYLKEKTGFDLVKALANIKAEQEEEGEKINTAKQGRRVAIATEEEAVPAGRRTTPKYNVVKKNEE